MNNRVLGRGLSSLLTEKISEINNKGDVHLIPITQIEANSNQHRKFFNVEKLNELAKSITSKGLLQPIIVKWDDNSGKYRIIAGERRFRACQIANIQNIHVIIKNCDEKEVAEIALMENIQRENITVMEEVNALAELICKHSYTQEEIAKMLGKSRSYVANMIRLAQLPNSIKEELNKGILTIGHARCLIGLKENDIEILSKKIIDNNLNVRQTEKLVNKLHKKKSESNIQKNDEDDICNDDILNIANILSKKLGAKVVIEHKDNKGKIAILYNTIEELDEILERIHFDK